MERKRIEHLLDRHFDAAATDAERAELERLLVDNAEAAAQFWKRADFQLALWKAVHTAQDEQQETQLPARYSAGLAGQRLPSPSASPSSSRSLRANVWRLTTWLSLGLAACLLTMLWRSWQSSEALDVANRPTQPTMIEKEPAQAPMPSAYVANLTGGANVEWDAIETIPSPRSRLLAGQVLEIRSGLLEVTFRGGAAVVLEGPARFAVVSADEGLLYSGKLSADVPEIAKGFRVTTPSAQLVDLGTRFGVAVNGDVTQASVFEGIVDGSAVDRQGHALGKQIRLTCGQAAQFVADAPQPVPIEARQIQFARRLPDRIEAVTIADADNPDRKLIRPVGVTSKIVTSFHPLERLIDGSGLSGNGPELTRTHVGNEERNLLDDRLNWKTGAKFLPIELIFDLGGEYDLKYLHLWNYSHPMPGMFYSRDARHMDVWVSLDGKSFTSVGSVEMGVYEGAAEHARSFPVAGRARYVCLQLTSSWGAEKTNEVGLGEVRFEGTAQRDRKKMDTPD